jgi:cob(I)alamin adenosyltransferase
MPSDKPFDEPRHVVLSKIYTRSGDRGQTSLVGGQRVAKDALRIDAYGTVDELNSFVGLVRTAVEEGAARHQQLVAFAATLKRIQHELFNLGSILATLPADVHPKQPRITAAEIDRLEQEIDVANQQLPMLRSFVLPGGSRLDAELHICRTICRRAERLVVRLAREGSVPTVSDIPTSATPGGSTPGGSVPSFEGSVPFEAVRYLNRLSDAFFVWGRWINAVLGCEETLWDPNAAASGDTP